MSPAKNAGNFKEALDTISSPGPFPLLTRHFVSGEGPGDEAALDIKSSVFKFPK